jgi:hypothetical protein
MRIEITIEDGDGVSDGRPFIGTRLIERETEPNRNEAKNRTEQDDHREPPLRGEGETTRQCGARHQYGRRGTAL